MIIDTVRMLLREILTALTGRPIATAWVRVPTGVVTSAYASGDAFGLSFRVVVPERGIIQAVEFLDFDNEKLGKDFVLFDDELSSDTADDTAWAMAVADAPKYQGTVSLTAADFTAANANALGNARNLGVAFIAPRGYLVVKCVTRGADNIAATADKPMVRFKIL